MHAALAGENSIPYDRYKNSANLLCYEIIIKIYSGAIIDNLKRNSHGKITVAFFNQCSAIVSRENYEIKIFLILV
ncbi:hypothetical protein D3C87_1799140 [compost metagenome]